MLLTPYASLYPGTEFGTPPHDIREMTSHCHTHFWSLKNVTQWSTTQGLHLLPSHTQHPEPELKSHIHHLPLYPEPSLLSEHLSAFIGQQAYPLINSANNLLGMR